ncbi:hypothetical protein OSTOST_09504 [Ostertagia ostertagi]
MGTTQFLVVDILIVLLVITTFLSNGCFLYMITRDKKLRRNFGLQLLIFLSIADFLLAVTTPPYVVYLLVRWHPEYIDIDPHYVAISTAPQLALMKIHLTLTLSIAIERILVIGILVITMTALVIAKLRSIRNMSAMAQKHPIKFRQANRISTGVLLISLVFFILPSVGIGFAEAVNYSIFKTVGPFYLLGLLCAGTCNNVVYFAVNPEIRESAKKMLVFTSRVSSHPHPIIM